jgi:uncharacterized protein DUF3859
MRTMRLVSRARSAIVVATLLLLFAPIAKAQQPRIDRLEVIDAGFLSLEQAESKDAPDAVGGKVFRPRNMRFLAEAPAVTAPVGTSFGVRFVVVGAPRNADVTLRSVWKIPPPGFTDPQRGKAYTESASNMPAQIGMTYLSAYGFNEAWEIVPGVWTLQVWQGDRNLLEHEFTIR